jgi:hypothetical protein
VVVAVGASPILSIALKLAGVEETVTVTRETPIVDTKATGTATNRNDCTRFRPATHGRSAHCPGVMDWSISRERNGAAVNSARSAAMTQSG